MRPLRSCLRLAIPVGLVVFSTQATLSGRSAAQEPAAEVTKEVRDLAGTYKGEWTRYGIDGRGEVVKRMSWTDTVKAEKPQVQDRRAFVTITDEMTFEGGKIPPFKVVGKEGYILKRDGTPGDYFFETNG